VPIPNQKVLALAERVASMPHIEHLFDAILRQAPMRDVAKLYCTIVVALHGGCRTDAAKKLKINRRSLQRWGVAEPIPAPNHRDENGRWTRGE